MTTIVASVSHGCIASDTRMTGEVAIGNISKLRRVGDCVYGIAGCIDPAFLFLEWLERLNPKESYRKRIEALHKMLGPDDRDSFTAIELSDSGLSYWSGWGVRVPLKDQIWGTGTGAAIAISHVKRGMDPQEAIRAAMLEDECSGVIDEPEVMYLLPPELLPKRRRGK